MRSDLQQLERKVDRLTVLLEEWHEYHLRQPCASAIFKDMVYTTLLGGVLGYFLSRVMDLYFGPTFRKLEGKWK